MNPELPQPPASAKPSKTQPSPAQPATAKPAAKPSKPPPPPPPKVPPLFRAIDWWAFAICFVIVGTIYFLTVAPEVTLEDSGELTTGSFWAGIPHPPGYPFWAIYSWLWTQLVPIGNVAWRVELGEAAAAAMGCSLIAFMVSRGSSMLMESIEELRGIVGKWENAICLVCGVTAGLLMALDNSMWKESVAINRISVFGVPWLIIVLLSLLRWIYAPQQRGYLYCAMFFFGICATIHQTLIVAAMGIEIGIACTQPKLGRDLFFGNSLVWIVLIAARESGVWTSFAQSTEMTFLIFNAVGIASIVACVWLAIRTGGILTEWKACGLMGLLWLAGASFYFYEAIAGMTNPPMEWGYPRTVEGFFHALTRGQYEKISPTDVIHDPLRFLVQLKSLAAGVADAFNWVYMFFAALPFLFFFKLQRRERNWLITVAAIYPFLGVLLTIFLNPSLDRQSADLLKVFYSASHTVVAILIGYGLALTAAYMATHYQKFRLWGWIGGGVTLILSLYCLLDTTGKHYFGLAGEVSLGDLPHWVAQSFAPGQYGLPIYANLILVALPVVFLAALAVYRTRAPLFITLALFSVMPVYSGLSHWFHSEQRHHWFGYWFGHDMFTPPFKGPDGKFSYDAKLREQAMNGTNGNLVYPEMAPDTVLFGGTDPGRFCPTYMIYCESFIPHSCQPEQDQKFSRRDVYLITQNAVADPTYLDYIRAQYNRSTQIDPPFFQNLLPTEFPTVFHNPTRAVAWLDDIFENLGAKIERRRRTGTSWFQQSDFPDAGKLAAQLRLRGQGNEFPAESRRPAVDLQPTGPTDKLSKFLYGKLSAETKALLNSKADNQTLGRALAKDFNLLINGPTIYDPERFQDIKLPPLIDKAVKDDQNQTASTRLRLNRRMLEEAYPDAIAKSLGGVYPDTEIREPNAEDSSEVYSSFYADAQRRVEHDMKYPNEPKQVRPDEIVNTDNGRLQVSGQGAVMRINGALTKVIFDRNPDHEFYVEESFPLDWMYPYLTPFGIIMKINRQPVPEITPEMIQRDHKFWCDYSERTIGNWITYDTPVKDICDFCEKVYVRHDYSGFKGDPKFIRDEDAQKSFSKLRNAIASSIYQWRADYSDQARRNPAVKARMIKETEFSLKQSFAFCPFSPEAVYHLIVLFSNQGRFEDMQMILKTCHDLDPYNGQFSNWLESVNSQLQHNKSGQQSMTMQQAMNQVEESIKAGKTNDAEAMLDAFTHAPQADGALLVQSAQWYLQLNKLSKATDAMQKLVTIDPNNWQSWYYLSRMQALEGKPGDAVASLTKAFALNPSDRVMNDKTTNFHDFVRLDPYFERIRATPQFQQATAKPK